ncbi:MAG: cell wall-binding repeat-containing protein [Clostridium argentinense]|uniref:Cell wall-binding repeat-containing protein n=1 Tax=Clostridium faecium TaxID=2762223 RepID=A0ABR8YS60_9CLOT|nr:cell wall-binding repeat-containing protein [Clostridium faecium]MBD8047059.1 cell wall-binding repeat-containing protein [Clostridium faecium]MBS5823529.1 cell wall-binding repeat-containing protein [Clostridium argentinense]MDU1348844.1 cell wall-binding repeat-containing protein [Clostridium argentinense]
MKKSSKVISGLLLASTFATMSSNVFAVETNKTIEKKLLAGDNRYETAVKVSSKWSKSENIVLVNAMAIADALSATPFAKLKDAPILLTDSAKLTEATGKRIKELGAKNVFVVGGEGVISKDVVKELEQSGLKVERISGANRFETSVKVAEKLNPKKVAVVNGLNGRLADALSVAGAAAENNIAILLTNGTSLGEVKDMAKGKEAVVVGGEGVVSNSIKEALKAERLGGANRSETNAEVLKKFYGGKTLKSIYVAKDGAVQENQLVDALSAGPVAGKEGAPIILAGSKISLSQESFLKSQSKVEEVTLVGGGINDSATEGIANALGGKFRDPSQVVEKAEVSSVTATNLKEVDVIYGTKVEKDSAEDVQNYSINNSGEIESIELLEDEKTARITMKKPLANQEKYKIKVEKILAKNDEIISGKDIVFTPMDNTIPEVKQVKNLGTKAIKVVFSEPVNTVPVNKIKIDGKRFSGSANITGREVVLTPYDKDLLKPGSYTISLEGITDFNDFKSVYSEHKLNIVEDKTAPRIDKAVATSEKLVITFSEDVDPSTVKIDNVYFKVADRKIKANDMKKLAGNKYEFYFATSSNRLPGYEITVYIDYVEDYSGNRIRENTVKVRPELDQTKPEVKNVTLSPNKKEITVIFSKNMHDDSQNGKYFSIKDEKGNGVPIKGAKFVGGDRKIIAVELYNELPQGKNTIKISGLKDATQNQNLVKEYIKEFEVRDTTPPTLESISSDGRTRTIVLTFSKKMDISTLENASNYLINFNSTMIPLPEDTSITPIQGGKGVRLILPEEIDNQYVNFERNVTEIQLTVLKDEAGNILKDYMVKKPILSESKAKVANAYSDDIKNGNAIIEDKRTIKVKFDQTIQTASRGDFKINLKGVDIQDVIANDSSIVTIKTDRDMPTDTQDLSGSGLILKINDGNSIRTSAGSGVDNSTKIRIVDKAAPEVPEDTREYSVDIANNDRAEVWIPFSEPLYKEKPELFAHDLIITSSLDEKVKLTPTIDYTTSLSSDGKTIKVLIKNTEVTKGKQTRYKIEIKENANFIQDLNKNKVQRKEALETDRNIGF